MKSGAISVTAFDKKNEFKIINARKGTEDVDFSTERNEL